MIPAAGHIHAPRRPTFLTAVHPAARWSALLLGLGTTYALPAPALLPLAALLSALLAHTGLGPWRQLGTLRPWLPMAVLVLAVHTFTTVDAAPLGRPSLAGLAAGAWALIRVAASLGWLGLFVRSSGVEDMAQGLEWWLRPWRGDSPGGAGLALAVALGTAPQVAAEGRRIVAVTRLRRGAAEGGALRRRLRDLEDRVRSVVPLFETMSRRADGLTLALQSRLPRQGLAPMSVAQGMALVLWLAALVWLVLARIVGGAP